MNTTNMATTEELKAESVSRMKLICLRQEYIDRFENNNEITVFSDSVSIKPELIGEDEELAIIEFEKEGTALVWAVIHVTVNEEGEDWDSYDMFYVSKDKNKWEEERMALAHKRQVIRYKTISSESNTVNIGDETIKIDIQEGILLKVD